MKYSKLSKWIFFISVVACTSFAFAQDDTTTNTYSNDNPEATDNGPADNPPPGAPDNPEVPTATTTSVTTVTPVPPPPPVTTEPTVTNTTVTTGTEASPTTTNVTPDIQSDSNASMSVTPAKKTVLTSEKQSMLTPQLVLQHLKEGNQRFMNGNMKNRDLLMQANTTAAGQYPAAVILNCMDSRTPPEIVFDQGIGDVFAIRIAGNIQNDDILGSMEFGTKLSGAKLIAVIGHTSCGAIRGACQQAKLGFLTDLLRKIQPAVKQAQSEQSSHDCNDNAFIDQIAKDNVMMVMKQIQMKSPIIKTLVAFFQVLQYQLWG